MGPKGKSSKQKPPRQGKRCRRKEGNEEEGEGDIGPEEQLPPLIAAEAGSDFNQEPEDDDLRTEDEDEEETTGKQKKEKYEFDAAAEQRLVEFFSENE